MHLVLRSGLLLLVVLSARLRAQDQEPSDLDRALEALRDPPLADSDADSQVSDLDRALEGLSGDDPQAGSDLFSLPLGQQVRLRLLDLSADLLFAVGGSSERDESIANLQAGGHDPNQRGFTLQNLELSFLGAVDPFFNFESHLIFFIDQEGETVLELEEAFFTTQQLPFGLQEWGFQLEAGQMFTEFGRHNPRHPHDWNFLDQPVIHARVFGPDGQRGPGARLGWLTPLPWFSEFHFGVQNARGETMASFLASDEFYEERAIAGLAFEEVETRGPGDFVWLGRWVNAHDFTPTVTAILGVSGLYGPNASGARGETLVSGADFWVRWRPIDHNRGWPFVSFDTEFLRRDYLVDESSANLPGEELADQGFRTQILWGVVRNWIVGARYEWANGEGPSIGGRSQDPFRDKRQRLAGLVSWMPTHFSRVRLQYNYDTAEHLEAGGAHTVWLGFEVLIGEHPAHRL